MTKNVEHNTLVEMFGEMPTNTSLADYLGVSPSAVSQYSARKRELMLLGLWVKRSGAVSGDVGRKRRISKRYKRRSE